MDDKRTHLETNKLESFKELIETINEVWIYLLHRWKIILIFGVTGAVVGLGLSFLVKPKYTASLSFALIEKASGSSGLAGLVSSFGLGGLIGGSGDAFTGDNLLEIMKSRYTVEKTLLSPIDFSGEKMTMVNAYIKINDLDKKWKNHNDKSVKAINFPIDQKRETFTRVQDSILNIIYNEFINSKQLTIIRKEKKISMVYVNFTSVNEEFSKCFVENLMNQTCQFYTETRTAQSRLNINMMQHTADSIKSLYEAALYSSAAISQININTAFQTAAVPRIKQENNAQLYGTVYAEVLKNLETLKLDLARETPIVQIIDTPRYPLKISKLGKAKGIVFGGVIGGVLIVFFLLIRKYLEEYLKNDETL
ncbi:MAG: hypothetical protein VB102_00280 [Paludibacter sp.]|nr:hypothetical protein [Paludibacter sp.]